MTPRRTRTGPTVRVDRFYSKDAVAEASRVIR
jgi:hypothetical protein